MRWLCACVIVCLLAACGGEHRPTKPQATVQDTLTPLQAEPSIPSDRDTTRIVVDSANIIRLNGMVMGGVIFLDQGLIQNWKEQYTINRALPAAYSVQIGPNATEKIRRHLVEAIAQAQDTLRETIAADKYGMPYGKLRMEQQAAVQKQFVILFQRNQ